jgi:hypothetical protein
MNENKGFLEGSLQTGLSVNKDWVHAIMTQATAATTTHADYQSEELL